MRAFRGLAVQAVRSEPGFWEHPQLIPRIERTIRTAPPVTVLGRDVYEWIGEQWSVCLDLEDRGVLSDRHLIYRSPPGKLGVRIIRLVYTEPEARRAKSLLIYVGKRRYETREATVLSSPGAGHGRRTGAQPPLQIACRVARAESAFWERPSEGAAFLRRIQWMEPKTDPDVPVFTWQIGRSALTVESASIQTKQAAGRTDPGAFQHIYVRSATLALFDADGRTVKRLIIRPGGKTLTVHGPTLIDLPVR